MFEIIKIHVELRDFYEANYQLDRAFHFGYHKSADLDQEAKGDNDTDDVPEKLQIYRKLVQAVILLMKRKFEAAMGILKEIDQGHKVKKESNDGNRKF